MEVLEADRALLTINPNPRGRIGLHENLLLQTDRSYKLQAREDTMESFNFGAAISRPGAVLSLAMASSLVLSHLSSAQDGKSCQPYTWDSLSQMRIAAADDDSGPTEGTLIIVNPGEVNCRYWTDTPKDVSYYTCSELAQRYDMPSDLFFTLNPSLDRDCGNIKPQTEYCVSGFIEPIRAVDGLCGPRHNNATCLGTDKQCCNSETWTCGDSTEDCAPGTCYEGDCVGDTVYSTDGTCGQDYGFRVCAGRWGSCCSLDGRCGTGDAFCGLFACQDGDCDIWKQDEQPAGTKWTKDGTCGGAEGMRCSAEWGRCCNVNGICGEKPADCHIERGCQDGFGICASTSTSPVSTLTSASSTPAVISTSTVPGTSTLGTTGTSVTTTSTSTAAPFPACTGGSNAIGITENLKGLCSYSCDFNHCPAGACVCTGPASEPADGIPELTGRHGCPDDNVTENLAYYEDLCEFTCSHGYCPSGACKYC
ncbi:hypothetical protein CSPX01_09022 [Colletotrichum filicis]|nr:hypothetical protein CSPX01_09022 [Colletotrichum filicis]